MVNDQSVGACVGCGHHASGTGAKDKCLDMHETSGGLKWMVYQGADGA
jgi:hypothetical protein